ncbi:uncharacterized protein LOC111372304 [Olea europaea var. sylvestris]|uniref:DUF4408 domain-containing protein n=1 Tax=Olea europaea subsp. europaea TaxID=158383 RepID=A0A8S0TNP6_OLEEU|nr:uncharacterized protein LOC111372304 [Olea europaea var. sylvestris]CAA3007608.1 Hypothetical predicted protein [Olea europaea subsp. europaea]
MAFLLVDNLPHNNCRFRTAIKALVLLLILAGLISTLLMVKGFLIPYSCEIVLSSLVGLWKSCKCFLSSPLYVCIIINFMVLLIAASSSLQRHETDNHDGIVDVDEDMNIDKSPFVSPLAPQQPPSPPPQIKNQNQPRDVTEVEASKPRTKAKKTTYQDDRSPQIWQDVIDQICVDKRDEEFPSGSFSNEALVETSERDMGEEKEARLENNHEEEDTMDATWRAITGEGKEKATKKQLKKSETWNVAPPMRAVAVQSHDLEELLQSIPASWKELRKSETFNDAISIRKRGGLRRDPSMSGDELNHQAEAFINKFNESIRLQRQESDQRFKDMINRGL